VLILLVEPRSEHSIIYSSPIYHMVFSFVFRILALSGAHKGTVLDDEELRSAALAVTQ